VFLHGQCAPADRTDLIDYEESAKEGKAYVVRMSIPLETSPLESLS